MDQLPDEQDEELCLCRKFVPENKRMDFDIIVTDPDTGKRRWKTVLRAHQDCPYHGLRVL